MKLSYTELIQKSSNLAISLYFYPVGDLVNKLSNDNKDNLVHKDEIKYDKNKNLKLTNFFLKSNKEKYNVKEESPFKIVDNTNIPKVNSPKNEILKNKIKEISLGKRKSDSSPDRFLSNSRKKLGGRKPPININILTDFIKKK